MKKISLLLPVSCPYLACCNDKHFSTIYDIILLFLSLIPAYPLLKLSLPSNVFPRILGAIPEPSSVAPHNASQNIPPIVTRTKTGNLKPEVFGTNAEPSISNQELSDRQWYAAMPSYYTALLNNKTWSLVPLLLAGNQEAVSRYFE